MEFVNDYKMFLIEARENNLSLHNINNKDLFHLLEIILDTDMPKNKKKENIIRYSQEHEIEKDGEEKGIIETGLEFGLSESDILERLQKKLDVSLQVAQEYFTMFGKETV